MVPTAIVWASVVTILMLRYAQVFLDLSMAKFLNDLNMFNIVVKFQSE